VAAEKIYLSKTDYLNDLSEALEDRSKDPLADLMVSDLVFDVDEYIESALSRGRPIEPIFEKLGSPEELADKFLARAYMRPKFRRAYDISRLTHLGLALNAIFRASKARFLKTISLLLVFLIVFAVGWSIIGTIAYVSTVSFISIVSTLRNIQISTAELSVLLLYLGGVFLAVFLTLLGLHGSGRLFRLSWVWVRSQANQEAALIEDVAR
jgi:uncharacterized membrane protein